MYEVEVESLSHGLGAIIHSLALFKCSWGTLSVQQFAERSLHTYLTGCLHQSGSEAPSKMCAENGVSVARAKSQTSMKNGWKVLTVSPPTHPPPSSPPPLRLHPRPVFGVIRKWLCFRYESLLFFLFFSFFKDEMQSFAMKWHTLLENESGTKSA